MPPVVILLGESPQMWVCPNWRTLSSSHNPFLPNLPSFFQKFRKGVGGQGWREEILRRPELQASFLYPFPYAPLGEGEHISGEFWGLFLGVCLSPTPSRQPLFETSDSSRRRTNVQQLTCKIGLSSSFYYLFLSFVLLELKPFVLKGKVPWEKL